MPPLPPPSQPNNGGIAAAAATTAAVVGTSGGSGAQQAAGSSGGQQQRAVAAANIHSCQLSTNWDRSPQSSGRAALKKNKCRHPLREKKCHFQLSQTTMHCCRLVQTAVHCHCPMQGMTDDQRRPRDLLIAPFSLAARPGNRGWHMRRPAACSCADIRPTCARHAHAQAGELCVHAPVGPWAARAFRCRRVCTSPYIPVRISARAP